MRHYCNKRSLLLLVNILAHKALLLAFGEGKPYAALRHVKLAAMDTEDVTAKPKAWWWYAGSTGLLTLACVAAASQTGLFRLAGGQ